ncbi:MAG: class I SAM-dependent methyltransferase [Spirochaetia bacterium]|nr:class I SAM-dependent methyltransferase [Spirochaetia bacterium]
MKNNTNEESGYFDEMSKNWDQNSMRNQIALNAARTMHKYITLSKNSVMLDFGCGTGLVSFYFYPHLQRLEGVDSSKGMVDEFNKKAAAENFVNAGAKVFDLDRDQLTDNTYDVIVSSMVFHHIKDPQALLKHLYDSLKNGGSLAIADLDEEDGSFHPPEAEGVHHNGFSRNLVKTWFEESGYKNIQLSTVMQLEKESGKYSIFLCVGKK